MEYLIKDGDTFFNIAQKHGVSCQDILHLNPQCNPNLLQIGQKIVLPSVNSSKGQFYAEISQDKGQEFAGESFDDVQVEVEGVKFRVKRVGEHRVPHEIHLILPRTEIHKVEQGPNGTSELQLMLSNVNIINSPRLMSEGSDKTEKVEVIKESKSPQGMKTTTIQGKGLGLESSSLESGNYGNQASTEGKGNQSNQIMSLTNERSNLSQNSFQRSEDEEQVPNKGILPMLRSPKNWFKPGRLFKRGR